ncbi:MAG TPA: transketolase [Myxococcota bacterium]|nr:transketolase [Myxococcota bacterium]
MKVMEAPALAERDRLCANALRMLAVDAVERAKSGHPGMPMGMAEIAVALWTRHLKHNPANPAWPDRDRFVLSNGHGSMLLYALLHLTGYDLPMAELARFRQMGSRTPGHPEAGVTPGVETTTGPLGQGYANAVGMALAERILGERFNRPGHAVVDHRTWAFVGDGCLMEGLSHEAASIAGTLRLGKLAVLYDANGISIDGKVAGWFTDDTAARFRAYGWNVIDGVVGHDVDAVDRAIDEARAGDRPTLVVCHTTIGLGSPAKAGTAEVHGAPLGAAEAEATRRALGWTHAPFEVPEAVSQAFDARAAGARREAEWRGRVARYAEAHPLEARELERVMEGRLPDGFERAMDEHLASIRARPEAIATRQASQRTIAALAAALPELIGGSADLTHSNLTTWPGARAVAPSQGGNYVSWGVREFGMAAAMNGMALHGGVIPFGGTFLVFSDYARNAVRLAALMRRRVIHVFTHDSIGLGEDGPTHQPVEHVASLRLIPGLEVWRPCDAFETAVAWREAVRRHDGPSALVLSRQALPAIERDDAVAAGVALGGYCLRAEAQPLGLVLAATGSEVALAMAAALLLERPGLGVRVVSLPCVERFLAQPPAFRAAVLPRGVPTLGVEAGHPAGLAPALGPGAEVHGIATFGESAPGPELMKHFGFTVEEVVAHARRLLA